MNSFADLSVKQLRRALAIKERLTKLQSQLEAVLGGGSAPGTGRTPGRRGRKRRSAATRAKMAAAQKG